MKPIDFIDHPEGGRFCEVFRSARIVNTQKGDRRSALTHIYFSLNPGEVSRFHRMRCGTFTRGQGSTFICGMVLIYPLNA